MARYIDADELYKEVTEKYRDITAGQYPFNIVAFDMAQLVKNAPTVNVVPKSEVEKAVDDLKRYIILNENIAIKCKQENGEQNEEYWKGKISAFKQIRAYIDAELKKKYTESEDKE